MYGTAQQVGTKIVCPDCGTASIVPPPVPPKQKPRLPDYDDEPLEVCEPIERTSVQIAGYGTAIDHAGPVGLPTNDVIQTEAGDVLPRFTFLSGIFSFPFRFHVWPRWMVLSLILAFVLQLISEVATLLSGNAGLTWMVGVCYMVMVSFIAVAWSITASVSFLAILQDTAEGGDKIIWPTAMWIDWVFECLYVVNSTVVSIVVGLAVARVMQLFQWPHELGVPVTVIVLFPFILLSMLEAASPVVFISRPVFHCLVRGWWAWLVVYLETSSLVAAVSWISWQLFGFTGYLAIVALSPLFVATLMIYFRLWGRLAWYCAKRCKLKDELDDESGKPPA
jgi:hypothetical protein